VASREQIPYNVHQNCSRVDQSTGRLAKFATAQYALDILGYNVWPVIKVKQFLVILEPHHEESSTESLLG
jgi:hypothetical protein